MIKLKQLTILTAIQLSSAFLSIGLATASTQYTPGYPSSLDPNPLHPYIKEPTIDTDKATHSRWIDYGLGNGHWDAMTNIGTSHAPESTPWLTAANWEAAKWDGTIYDPYKMSHADFYKAICPSNDQIRGIQKLYHDTKPFADEFNPTKAEVDEWHRHVINHIRKLVGYIPASCTDSPDSTNCLFLNHNPKNPTSPIIEDRRAKPDRCLFALTLWANQRKYTRMWDAVAPTNTCLNVTSPHCGESFVPSADQQKDYLPADHATCLKGSPASGVFPTPKTNAPWSIKISRAICNTIQQESFWGGHVGPWFFREKFGLSFWEKGGLVRGIATLRSYFEGALSTIPVGPKKVGSTVIAGDFDEESHPNKLPIQIYAHMKHFRALSDINGTPSWIKFSDFDFGTAGANTIHIINSRSASISPTTDAAISVRLGSPTGTVLARIIPLNTAQENRVAMQKVRLSGSAPITGTNNLYLTFEGKGYHFHSFRFEKE